MSHEQFDFRKSGSLAPWPRKSARFAINAEVMLRRPGKLSYRVKVHDASCHGCKIDFVERPIPADRAWIKFEGLEPLAAEVCWVKGFATGLRFEKPIHPAVFERLLKTLGRNNGGGRS